MTLRKGMPTRSAWSGRALAFALAALAGSFWAAASKAADVQPHPELAQQATWKSPQTDEVHALARTWLKERQADDATVQTVESLWADAAAKAAPEELLNRLTASFAAADPEARALVDVCSHPREGVLLPSFAGLADDKIPAIERLNLRLLYGRWLVQERLYDEALAQLEGLKPAEVVDPGSLLFFQAVVYQRMLKRDAGLEALNRLLEPGHEIPRRYGSLARLMQADLSGLKDESLDHIARRMDDVTRRLDLGRAGPKVREVEDGVIKSLDKLIEQMEEQEAAAAKMGMMGQGSLRPSMPAPDSVPLGGRGPGNVTQKNIGNKSGWGDMPAKQRQEALQQIGKDFPAHYRDVIEQYFRKLASEDREK